jgi:hypothetical protein
MENVYFTVRTASLNKTNYVPSLKGKDAGTLYKIDIPPSIKQLHISEDVSHDRVHYIFSKCETY